jgi:ribosome recycling factor
MNPSQVLADTKTKLNQATGHFKDELQKMRTGRAHPGMLDSIMVQAYGQAMPLKAVASITVPEPQQLQITPFDANNLKAISEAISGDQSLGLNPADDGRVVRVQIPPLTQETRQQMVKVLHQKLEETMIAGRNVRHDAIHMVEQSEKDKNIGKDERFHLEKQIDDLLAQQKRDAEELTKSKEQEILTV